MAIIAVLGRKGGIGKSTIVGNLAGEFAAMGRSVIVLDFQRIRLVAETVDDVHELFQQLPGYGMRKHLWARL